MKRIAIIAMAVAAFAACNKSEVIEAPKGVAIEFDNAFVNNATKANDINKDNLQDFGVYGFVEASTSQGQIFKNQRVAKTGDSYTYSPAQYWIANAQYYFTAIAPATGAAWSYETTNAQNGTLSFNNETAAANQDLLFAFNKPSKTAESISTKPAAVAFDFYHMLSRVKFTFTNGFGAGSNITLKVTDVTITDAYKTGTLAVTDGEVAEAWTPAEKEYSIAFGAAGTTLTENGGAGTTEHFYLIPANATYNVTFNVELFQAGVSVDKYARTATLSHDMKKGFSYEIKATLNAQNTSDDGELYPIEFTVNTVDKWENFADVNGTVNQ